MMTNEPIRFLFKGCGLTIWKLAGYYTVLFHIFKWYFGLDLFRYGYGLHISFRPLVVVKIVFVGEGEYHSDYKRFYVKFGG